MELGSHLAGQPVSSLSEEGKYRVCAVDRMGTPTIPGASATFQEGDVAHVIVAREAIDELRARLEEQH
jgi:Trk K+ transport system NAD-binding subunit